MKLYKILFAVFACGVGPSGADAVTKCISIPISSTNSSETLNSNWYSNNGTLFFEGVAVCAAGLTDYDTYGTENDVVQINISNVNKNNVCWCKMTEPAVSRWYIAEFFQYHEDCVELCAQSCGLPDTGATLTD